MVTENCSCCRYFLTGFGDRLGSCRRFPSFQNRSAAEWCGEFKAVDKRLKQFKEVKDDKTSA